MRLATSSTVPSTSPVRLHDLGPDDECAVLPLDAQNQVRDHTEWRWRHAGTSLLGHENPGVRKRTGCGRPGKSSPLPVGAAARTPGDSDIREPNAFLPIVEPLDVVEELDARRRPRVPRWVEPVLSDRPAPQRDWACLAHVPAGRVSARTCSKRDVYRLTPSVGVSDDLGQFNGPTSCGVTCACRSVSGCSAWLCSCSRTQSREFFQK
jgi:hypothetical protein